MASSPGRCETAEPPRIAVHSSLREGAVAAGEHPEGIILSANARPEPAGYSWEINGWPIDDLPPELGRIQGSPRRGILVYIPPADLSGPPVVLSYVAVAEVAGREIRSAPFRLALRPKFRGGDARTPSGISMVRTREEPLHPTCKATLETLNVELAAYAELLRKERNNEARNEDVIAVLTRIRTLSDQARHCTGHNLGLLDKLRLSLVNRLSILIKDKARNLWARYDALAESLQTAAPDETPPLLRRIFQLQIQIKGMYERYDMEMSQGIVDRLQKDNEMIRDVLNGHASESNRPSSLGNAK
ncbi:MAG: hypothetical protein ACLFRG_14175 [Desulfococcaceae bacterium]